MDKVSIQMRVMFEDPFWIAIIERNENSCMMVSKVTFGSEPKDYEIYQWMLKQYCHLQFSPPITNVVKSLKHHPKKQQRDIKKQITTQSIGTKSQQALKLQQELLKAERHANIKKNKQDEKQRRFKQKQQKRKEKHRGR